MKRNKESMCPFSILQCRLIKKWKVTLEHANLQLKFLQQTTEYHHHIKYAILLFQYSLFQETSGQRIGAFIGSLFHFLCSLFHYLNVLISIHLKCSHQYFITTPASCLQTEPFTFQLHLSITPSLSQLVKSYKTSSQFHTRA
jgi:hypothetical protein